MVKHHFKLGYTLMELVVVLSIISLLAAIVFFGLSNYNNTDTVNNAAFDFLSALRAQQNKVVNGADGDSVKWVTMPPTGSTYYVSSVGDAATRIDLPAGVVYTLVSTPDITSVCFSNPNLDAFSCGNHCGSSLANCGGNGTQDGVSSGLPCYGGSGGSGYICDRSSGGNASSPMSFRVRFSNAAGYSKDIVVEGVGLIVNRIYVQ